MSAAAAGAAPVAPTTLVAASATWKYLADGSNQGTAWRGGGFNDAAWASGAAHLGYGDGDEVTVIPFADVDPNTAAAQKNATTYFRRTFTVANRAAFGKLSLSLIQDDAAAVYLNGTQVFRDAFLPLGAPFNYYAKGAERENDAVDIGVDPALLVNGTNVIAVEMHQSAPSGADLSFALGLTGGPSASTPRFTVDFAGAPLDAASVQAGDVRVDGAPATAFSIVDADTVAFDLPRLAAGAHTVTIAAGAITGGGEPVQAFSAPITTAVDAQYVVKYAPYLQPGNAPLTGFAGGDLDRVDLLWQTVPPAAPAGGLIATAAAGSSDSFAVEYRKAGAAAFTALPAGAVSQLDARNAVEVTSLGRVQHQVTLAGLDWDADYEYRVTHLRDGVPVAVYGPTTFHTRLATTSDAPFAFAAYGDSDFRDGAVYAAVQARINQTDAAFALLLGDNVYNSGMHAEADSRFDGSQAAPRSWIDSHVNYLGWGNHDIGDAVNVDWSKPTEADYSVPVPDAGTNAPNAPAEPDLSAGTPWARAEHTYSFDYGGAHFVTFDSNAYASPSARAAAINYLAADLAAAKARSTPPRWLIVYAHHPAIGAPDKVLEEGADKAYYRELIPVMKGLGVDLFLTGHSHTYAWTQPLTGFAGAAATYVADADKDYAKGAGVVEVISGVGGNGVRAATYVEPVMAAWFTGSGGTGAVGVQGFTKVDVTPDRLTVSYVNAATGAVVDAFRISAPADLTPPAAAVASPADNGPGDSDGSDGALAVLPPATIQVQLSDAGGAGVRDASVTVDAVTVKRDGTPLVAGVDYAFAYDAGADRITLAPPAGQPFFAPGTYAVTVGPAAHAITDDARVPNVMPARTFTIKVLPDAVAPTFALLAPVDNGPYDDDFADGRFTVAPQTAIRIQLSDVGTAVDDASVTSAAFVLSKGGVPLVAGTHYAFAYDPAADRVTLTPIGLPYFDVGQYALTISPPASPIGDLAGPPRNVMPATTLGLTLVADTAAPTAAMAAPLDNGPDDRNTAVGPLRVSPRPTFVIALSDVGTGIDDATVTSGRVSVTLDGAPLVAGTHYAFAYDPATDRVTLAAIGGGGTFAVGTYRITVSPAAGNRVADRAAGAANEMPAKVLTVVVADDTAPTAALVVPADDGPDDANAATAGALLVAPPPFLRVQLADTETGIDDASVTAASVTLSRDGTPLVAGTHFQFTYAPAGDVVRLTPVGAAGFAPGTYVLRIGAAGHEVLDRAGNAMATRTYTLVVRDPAPAAFPVPLKPVSPLGSLIYRGTTTGTIPGPVQEPLGGTSFDGPVVGARSSAGGAAEVGFGSTVGVTGAAAAATQFGVFDASANPLTQAAFAAAPAAGKAYVMRGTGGGPGQWVTDTLAFDPVDLGGGVAGRVSMRFFLADTAYEAEDYVKVRIKLTGANSTVTTAVLLDTTAPTFANGIESWAGSSSATNAPTKGAWKTLSFAIPDGYVSGQFEVEGRNGAADGAEAYVIDDVRFTGGTANPVTSRTYAITLDADQLVTIVARGAGVRPAVSLSGPGLAAKVAEAASAGAGAILQSAVTLQAGVHYVTVFGLDGTAGDFTLDLILNAAAEAEAFGGAADDTRATAQAIDAALRDFGANAVIGGVVGVADAPANGAADFFALTLTAGVPLSLALSGTGVSFELQNAQGNVVATPAVAGPDNASGLIQNYVPPAGGTYYVRVAGTGAAAATPFTLSVLRGPTFDAEPNNAFDHAQDLTQTQVAFGHVDTAEDGGDYYKVTLAPGEQLRAVAGSPNGGPAAEPGDAADYLRLDLFDAAGAPLVTDFLAYFPSGVDPSLPPGTYVLRVESAGGEGSYVLRMQRIPDTVPPTITDTAFAYDAHPHRVRVTFSEDVGPSLAPSDLKVQAIASGGQTFVPASVSFDPGTNTATFTFAAPLPDGDYHATLAAAGVTDRNGNPMAADVAFDFFAFAADVNRDRTVDFNDLVPLAQHYNVADGQRMWADGDFTGDGNVDFDDLVKLAQNYNTSLPGAGASPAAAAPFAAAWAAALAPPTAPPVIAAPAQPTAKPPPPEAAARPTPPVLKPKPPVIAKPSVAVKPPAPLKKPAKPAQRPAPKPPTVAPKPPPTPAASPAPTFGTTRIKDPKHRDPVWA